MNNHNTGTVGCVAVLREISVLRAAILLLLNTGYIGLIIITAIFIVLGIVANIARFL